MDTAENLEPEFGDTATLDQWAYEPLDDYDGETTEVLSEKYRRYVDDDL